VLRRWMVDAGIALAVLVAGEIAIATGREADSIDRNWFAYLLGVAMAAPLLLRQRYPTVVLYAVSAALLLFYALGYPGFSPALVLAVPLHDATRAGRLWWALPVPVFFLTAGAVAMTVHRGIPALDVLATFLPQAAMLAVAILLGALMRSRAAYAAEVRHRLDRAEREREREAQRRVTEERLRIARDLHDTVGHAIATITVQSAAALHMLDRDPERSREALEAIRGTGRAALAEMRATLGVLRSGDATAPPDRDAGLDRLPELLTAVRAAGLRVEVDSDLAVQRLPGPVDQVVYRILQEALTNVLRHAGQRARAEVLMRAAPESVTVEVRDDGPGVDAGVGVGVGVATLDDPGGGRGLKGMRERVEALGGQLTAAPRSAGGFQVRATLPRAMPAGTSPARERLEGGTL
jgi:signal transduction histidine kinase